MVAVEMCPVCEKWHNTGEDIHPKLLARIERVNAKVRPIRALCAEHEAFRKKEDVTYIIGVKASKVKEHNMTPVGLLALSPDKLKKFIVTEVDTSKGWFYIIDTEFDKLNAAVTADQEKT